MGEHDINQVKDTNNIWQSLNLRAKSVNWTNIIDELKETNWDKKIESIDAIQSGGDFIEILENSTKENAPKRGHKGNNSKIPRERKKLHNRIKMLKREKHRAYSKEKKRSFE